MTSQRLLYLTTHGMRAYCRQAGRLTLEEQFPPEAAGHLEFGRYLTRLRKIPFTLLVNLAEEGFHEETIPLLRGSERQAVIHRKNRQLFHNAWLTAALSLGIEKNRRHDERLLLTALTGKDSLLPWLDAFAHSAPLLRGIHSLPLVSTVLTNKLRLPDKNFVLATIQDQSLRQSYFSHEKLRFSRLTPLPDIEAASIAHALSIETSKLQHYLTSHRLAERNETLAVYLLADHDTATHLRGNGSDSPSIRYHILELGDCEQRAGLNTALPDSRSELLFLDLLAKKPPAIQFAGADLRHPYRLRQIGRCLLGTAATILLCSATYAGLRFHEAGTIDKRTEQLLREARQLTQRHDEIAKTLPPLPVDHESLNQIIERYRTLTRDKITPQNFYRQLSQALRMAPAVELDRIDWQRSPAGMANPGHTENHVLETAIIRGSLKTVSASTPIETQGEFQRLTEALATPQGGQLTIEQHPGDFDTARNKPTPEAFVLKITRSTQP